MIFDLVNCVNGKEEKIHKTKVDIQVENDIITFTYYADNCKYWCPYRGYNKIHSVGDCVEILIGSDPDRKVYYEIELSPLNELMIAKMTYLGEKKGGKKILLNIDFVKEPFVDSQVIITKDGYIAKISFPLSKIKTGDGEIFFNAYRLETEGGKYIVKQKCGILLQDNQLLFALNPTMRPKFHTPSCYLPLFKTLGEK